MPNISFGEIVTDLNGFRLWQFRNVVIASYGEPDRKMEQNDFTHEAFFISEKAYMVFGYLSSASHNIYSIQITGDTNEMLPFKGLVLGDNVVKVNKQLGLPTNIRQIEKPRVDIYEFENTNYTIEIDESGKLFSIKISVKNKLFENASFNDEHWGNFKKAVMEKNLPKIINCLRPDVEIYKDGKTLSINKKISEFNNNPNQEFIQAIIAEKNSVYTELTKSEPESEMRVQEKMGVGSVYKFYKGNMLREIVFFPYNGKYRIYEIAFKKKK